MDSIAVGDHIHSKCLSLCQDYYKALEDADEKVQLANQIYDLVSIITLVVLCVNTSCFQ